VEDAAGAPEELEDVGFGGGGGVVVPGDEGGVLGEPFHANVFFDGDGEAVEGADGLVVGGEVDV
jgi:hypothetical protein